ATTSATTSAGSKNLATPAPTSLRTGSVAARPSISRLSVFRRGPVACLRFFRSLRAAARSLALLQSCPRPIADERQSGTAAVIDGTSAAKYGANQSAMPSALKEEVAILRDQNPRFSPTLAIVQVGAREDSNAYIRMKEKAAAAVRDEKVFAGVETRSVKLSEGVSQEEVKFNFPRETDWTALLRVFNLSYRPFQLLDVVKKLNADPSVHGILVQLPLPESINDAAVTDAIDPRKDVDGLHPTNVGALSKRNPRPLFVPCTPKGVMELLRWSGTEVAGKTAVVVGRSDLGAPVAALLTAADATVTLCHSKTRELPNIICHADILVAAIGRAEYIRGEWIKPGAVVIDVGMNSSGTRWVGDVDYEGASRVASAVTPVPGGVGPMTVAMLIDNVVISAKRAVGIEG
ncbi:MAG: tetrahydrofolate dehydrogenase/cyclohydrolase, partial [Olpidium bornovanus]